MPTPFAAAIRPIPHFIGRFERRRVACRAANDNAVRSGSDAVLRDALKHFARHGLGAAEAARTEAEQARFAGDHQGYQHWLDICRTLDRRMASALSTRGNRPRP